MCMNYLGYCISENATVREVMKKLDATSPQIVFVVRDEVLVGSVTDGDIRRFLLKGGSLTDNISAAVFRGTRTAKTVDEAARLYHCNNYPAIPIITQVGRIKDVYIGNAKTRVEHTALHIPVVINAGGKGTRLEPYTKILPKPLIPVGDKPIIEHIMNQFSQYACNDFHVIVNYKKAIMKAYFAESEIKQDITWYDEEIPLGTGGGLCYLKGKMQETFFFTNCDNLLLSDYENILSFHRENQNSITMICAYKHVAIPYGVVDMGVDGAITDMKEKPEFSFLTNTGIYVLEPDILDDIEDMVPIGFPDVIEKCKALGKKVAVYPVRENEWLDMGQMPELEKMRIRLETM